jgi:hypothetical protein
MTQCPEGNFNCVREKHCGVFADGNPVGKAIANSIPESLHAGSRPSAASGSILVRASDVSKRDGSLAVAPPWHRAAKLRKENANRIDLF